MSPLGSDWCPQYRHSDPAKTVLDLAYLDYWHERKGKPVAGTWREHADRVDETALEEYADRYPEEVARAVRDEAGSTTRPGPS